MFPTIGIDAQLQLQRPYLSTATINSALNGDADNVFRFGDTSLYPDYGFTICMWYAGVGSGNTFNYLTGRETASTNRQHQIYIYYNTLNSVVFLTGVGSTQYILQPATAEIPQLSKWYFVAATAKNDGTGLKDVYFFDESQLLTSGTTSDYPSITSNNNFRYIVGGTRNTAGGLSYEQRQGAHGVWNAYKDADFIKSIWNYGRGLQYDDLTTDQKTDLVEYFNLGDWDGTDCTGSLLGENLTKNANGLDLIFNSSIKEKLYVFDVAGTKTITLPSGYSTMQYLIVGGGAGGGGSTTANSASGGGGAGEVLEGIISSPSGGTYTVIVGAGGTALANTSTSKGNNGSSSSINSIVALGGKGGAGSAAGAGNASSLEGAGGGSSILAYIGKGTGTNEGGAGTSSTAAGTGGGSNGDGSTATSTTATPTAGGAGTISTYFAGTFGVGGGAWAYHATARVGISGAANSGNGGSGKVRVGSNNANSAGGSGIVFIKLIP